MAGRLIEHKAPVVAVSPIVSGLAIKGPAAKMMEEMQLPQSALGVAEYYVNIIQRYWTVRLRRPRRAQCERHRTVGAQGAGH